MDPALNREPTSMVVDHGLDCLPDECLQVVNIMEIWEANILALARGRNRLGGTKVCYSTIINSKGKYRPLQSKQINRLTKTLRQWQDNSSKSPIIP